MGTRHISWATAVALIWGGNAVADTAATEAQPDADELEVTRPKPAVDPVTYDNGFKLQTSDGSYALVIKGRLQSRYSFDSIYEDGEGPPLRTDEGELGIARARLTFKGKAEALEYKFQADFSDGFKLKDFFADYRPTDGPVRIRVGRFKRPSSRQHIGSSSTLNLVDRPLAHDAFKNLRDTGIAVHNDYEDSPTFEWVVGFFSASAPGTVSTREEPAALLGEHLNPAFLFRVGYNYGGIRGYREADLRGGPMRFSVGLGSTVELDGTSDNDMQSRSTVDYIAKLHGFSATGALFVASAQDGSGASSQGLDALGGYQQLGFVVFERLQPALRYGFVDYQGPVDDDRHELTAGLALYQMGHNLKLNTDATAFFTEGQGEADYQVRTQLQLIF